MNTKSEELKRSVKEKYAQISEQSKQQNKNSCCGTNCGCDTVDYTVFAESYTNIEGHEQVADLGLGCGLPTEFAQIKKGDTVVDLGSGAGNDCFVARKLTGPQGRVVGVDMTDEMVEKAEKNVSKLGFENVEFVLSDIEDMPLKNDTADVVVSNCVLNLVPDKQKAFAETLRVLKPGGHFSISDVVITGDLPEPLKEDAQMYAGCVAGAINKKEYLSIIEKAGFAEVMVQEEKEINLPPEIMEKYLKNEEIEKFNNSEVGIFSITVYAKKPS